MLSGCGCQCASDDQDDVAVLQVEATRRARSLRLSVLSRLRVSAIRIFKALLSIQYYFVIKLNGHCFEIGTSENSFETYLFPNWLFRR